MSSIRPMMSEILPDEAVIRSMRGVGLAHHFAADFGSLGRVVRDLSGLFGTSSVFGYGRRQSRHRLRCFRDGRRLPVGSRRQIVRT